MVDIYGIIFLIYKSIACDYTAPFWMFCQKRFLMDRFFGFYSFTEGCPLTDPIADVIWFIRDIHMCYPILLKYIYYDLLDVFFLYYINYF